MKANKIFLFGRSEFDFELFGNLLGNAYTKFVIGDIKFCFTSGKWDLC